MKTEEEIRAEYRNKVMEYAQKKEDDYSTRSDGTKRDRSAGVTVTDMCVWTTYCPKQVFYDKTARRPPLPEASMRFQIGHAVHEIPMWDNVVKEDDGFEQAFEWDGIRCRMDEINYKEGIIIDKKTVSSLPVKVKPYVERQLNIYKLIAEENEKRPIKINQLFAINIAVINGKIQVQEVPIWPRNQTIDFIEKTRTEIMNQVRSGVPPEIEYGSKGWLCEGCSYTDICQNNKPIEVKNEEPKKEDTPGIKVSAKKRK